MSWSDTFPTQISPSSPWSYLSAQRSPQTNRPFLTIASQTSVLESTCETPRFTSHLQSNSALALGTSTHTSSRSPWSASTHSTAQPSATQSSAHTLPSSSQTPSHHSKSTQSPAHTPSTKSPTHWFKPYRIHSKKSNPAYPPSSLQNTAYNDPAHAATSLSSTPLLTSTLSSPLQPTHSTSHWLVSSPQPQFTHAAPSKHTSSPPHLTASSSPLHVLTLIKRSQLRISPVLTLRSSQCSYSTNFPVLLGTSQSSVRTYVSARRFVSSARAYCWFHLRSFVTTEFSQRSAQNAIFEVEFAVVKTSTHCLTGILKVTEFHEFAFFH